MDNKDLISLMEAYDSLATPTGENAASPELSKVADVTTQTSSEGDSQEERKGMIHSNLKTIGQHLSEIEQAIGQGHEVEPWMEEKIAVATDSIVRIANAIRNR
jgi:hypothetical protein